MSELTLIECCKQLSEKRVTALVALLKLFQSSDNDELLKAAQRRVCSYFGSKTFIAMTWDEGGALRPAPTGYRGRFGISVKKQDSGFQGLLWHWIGERTEKVIDFTSMAWVTPDETIQELFAWAKDNAISTSRLPYQGIKVWYKGDRDWEADKAELARHRKYAIDAVHRLIMAGANKSTTPEQVEELLLGCRRPLEAYISIKHRFNYHWDAEGTWTGKKRLKRKKEKVDGNQGIDGAQTV